MTLLTDLVTALAVIGYTLKSRDIVLVRTGRDAFYGSADYMFRGCAVTPDRRSLLRFLKG